MSCRQLPEWKILCLLLLLIAACTRSAAPELDSREQLDEYGYRLQYSTRKGTDIREGQWKRLNADNVIIEEATYRNDTLQGQRVLYYDTGDTLLVEHYEQGLFEGPYRAYYDNRQPKTIGQYRRNEISGQWLSYYPDGTLREEVTFDRNTENGPFNEYHPNGRLKAQGHYLDGDNEHGELKLYDEEGQLIRTMVCDMGRCKTRVSQ
jgi:antitoxin component YwqK of YwqJK toxin-antitoxin module